MTKRYLLFTGDYYYPLGGFNDFHMSADDVDSLLEVAANYDCDWWQIVDLTILKIIKEGSKE